jgi:hypothetical protein
MSCKARLLAALALSALVSARNATSAPPRYSWWASDYSADRAARTDVAFAIAGEMRTFDHEVVLANWQAAVFTPLRPDLFMHISGESSLCATSDGLDPHDRIRRPPARLQPNWQRNGCLSTKGLFTREWLRDFASDRLVPNGLVELAVRADVDVLRAYERLPFENVKTEKELNDSGLNTDPRALPFPPDLQSALCGYPKANPTRTSLALRWLACLRGIERAERELRTGRLYRWIVRVRPDYVWDCIMYPPPRAISHCGRHAIGENDFLTLTSRALGAITLSLVRFAGRVGTSHCYPLSCCERSACFDFAIRRVGGLPHSTCADRHNKSLCFDAGLGGSPDLTLT